jgi:hypothetical protein
MRKETRDVMTAFLKRKSCTRARTQTNGDVVTLHGNKIAWREPDGSISMTLAGWGTPTTRDRLNGLCLLLMDKKPFHQKKGVQYYDDKEIDTTQVITVHTLIESSIDEQRAWYDTSAELT